MKKIFLLVGVLCAYFASQAQFPTTDSLRKYNNKVVTNNAVDAFAQKRLNTLIHGIINWIDTARLGEGGSLGVDTLYALNDTTVRYKKNGQNFQFSIKGAYDARRRVDTLFKLNDTTLRFTINGAPRDLLFKGTEVRILTDTSLLVGADTLKVGSGSVDGGANLGSGYPIYAGKDGRTMQFNSVDGDSSIGINSNDNLIQFYVRPDVFASVSRLNDSMAVARSLNITLTTIGSSGAAEYDPDTRTLNIPVYVPDTSSPSEVMPGYINILHYGAKLNSISDTLNNYLAVEAAKVAAKDGDIVYCPGGGTLYTSRTLEFVALTVNSKRYQVQFNCKVVQTDKTKNGFRMEGNWRQSLYVYSYDGGNPVTTDSATYNDTYTASGILAYNSYNSEITVGEIVRCRYGIEIRSDVKGPSDPTADGSQYIHIKGAAGGPGLLWGNYAQIYLNRAVSGGWVNEITIENMQLGRGKTQGNNGVIGFLSDAVGSPLSSALESNFLVDVGFEGLRVGSRVKYASSLSYIDCRIEGPAVKYHFDMSLSAAEHTKFYGGGPYTTDWFIDQPAGIMTEVLNAQFWGDVAIPQTSTTSNILGTGSKTFTIATGLSTYSVGAMAKATADTGHIMFGTVTSYNSSTGEVVLNITSVKGTGTYANWAIKAKSGQGRMGTGLSTLPASPVLAGIPDQAGKVVVRGTHYPGFTAFNNMYHTENMIQMYDFSDRPTVNNGIRRFGNDIYYGAYEKRIATITTQTSINFQPNVGWVVFNPSVGNVTARVHSSDLLTQDFKQFMVDVKNTTYSLTVTNALGTILIASTNFPAVGLYVCTYAGGSFSVTRIDRNPTGSGGGGDASTNATTSVVNEMVLFADATGKLLKRSIGTGYVYTTSGVVAQRTRIPFTDLGLTSSTALSGTPSSTTFLRGDGTWATPAGGVGGSSIYSAGNGTGNYWFSGSGSVNYGVNPSTSYAFHHYAATGGTTRAWVEFAPTSDVPSAMRAHSIAYDASCGCLVIKGATGTVQKILSEDLDADFHGRYHGADIHPDFIWDGSAPLNYVLMSNGVNGSFYGIAPNLYNIDGTIGENRVVSQNGHLMFNGAFELRKYGGLARFSNSVSGTSGALAAQITGNSIRGQTYNGSSWVDSYLTVGVDGQNTTVQQPILSGAMTLEAVNVPDANYNYTTNQAPVYILSGPTAARTFTIPTASSAGIGRVITFVNKEEAEAGSWVLSQQYLTPYDDGVSSGWALTTVIRPGQVITIMSDGSQWRAINMGRDQ